LKIYFSTYLPPFSMHFYQRCTRLCTPCRPSYAPAEAVHCFTALITTLLSQKCCPFYRFFREPNKWKSDMVDAEALSIPLSLFLLSMKWHHSKSLQYSVVMKWELSKKS